MKSPIVYALAMLTLVCAGCGNDLSAPVSGSLAADDASFFTATALSEDPVTIDQRLADAIDDGPPRVASASLGEAYLVGSYGSPMTSGDTTRIANLSVSSAEQGAVAITNVQPGIATFDLTHNGHLAFATMDQVVEAVRSMPDEVPDERFERKLWRFVRDNTYHYPPVSAESWTNGTWYTLNSFGWGFCSNVAAVYVQIAQAAGYQGRVWALEGHVVPEIFADGQWQMFDPDLAVYYHNYAGTVAGLEELMSAPALVSAPVGPIVRKGLDRGAYSDYVAGIYGSVSDNREDLQGVSSEPFRGSRITLQPGARLIYPGRWTPSPVVFAGGEPEPYVVEHFRQARLELPAGYTGVVGVPWVLWDVQGAGQIRVLGREFASGSPALGAFLLRPGESVAEIEILDNPAGLALIMMINPLWYDMLDENEIQLSGTNVDGLDIGIYPLAEENQPPPPVPVEVRKPRACGDGFGNRCDPDLDNSGGPVDISDYRLFRAAYGTVDANADLDCSGGPVDDADLDIFMAAFGTTIIHADLDGNGSVNVTDFAIFRNALGTRRAYGDLDYSGGPVDIHDFALFRQAFGGPGDTYCRQS